MKIFKKKDDQIWKDISFCVFDTPSINGTYEHRQRVLQEMDFPPHVQIIESSQCTGKEHLKRVFDRIINEGGEGVILRNARSMYEHGRSPNFCKLKVRVQLLFLLTICIEPQ